jgi:methyl-accepting chemotaxis protein
MASFKFRIGTKLGIVSAISILLVGGMLVNQALGNRSIVASNGLLILNYLNKGNAQSAQTAIARAETTALEIASAQSVARIDELLQVLRAKVTEAETEIDAARDRARQQFTKDAYQAARQAVGVYLASAIELADAQKRVLGANAGAKAEAEAAKVRVLNERTLPAAAQVNTAIDKGVDIANEYAAKRRSQVLEELNSTANFALIIGVAVMLTLIGSAAFSVLSIARPVRRIGEVLLELANGNKAVEIPFVDRLDEIGDNARAANTFKENLIRIEQMEAAQKDSEAAAAAARKAAMLKLADEFQAAIGGIVNTVSSASAQLESAADTLTSTADSTKELAGMVAAASEEASANVGAVASATEEMSASVLEIGRQVQDSSRIAGEAVKQAEKTDARITELSQAASRIGDVVKLITAIAEQTNLLALNATIEAARAGDAGRGFAVVASEVKALAAQTAKATDEIATQIAGMQVATQESVSAIKEISNTIGQISEIAQTIAATLEEQAGVTTEIARNVGEAAKGTVEVADKITEVNRGTSATGAASGQVLSSARSLSSESGLLKAEVEKFLDTVRAA